ncbi:hypothetical protein [Azorhizobium caulinodans]|uniref:hypothetical protein n=1 Tax=Azorhizobium caulinodans TaxID=7 RepID=UPI002FBDFFC1
MSLSPYVLKGKVGAALGEFGSVTASGAVTAGTTVTATTALAAGTTVTAGTQFVTSAATTITAFAGGGQASATQLSKGVNHVTTVATAADSVKLPASAPGLVVHVINGAASNSMQVFGAGTDTINDVATATGVAQAAGKSATYVCPVAGKWYRVLSA